MIFEICTKYNLYMLLTNNNKIHREYINIFVLDI